jgi:hypothetical protein
MSDAGRLSVCAPICASMYAYVASLAPEYGATCFASNVSAVEIGGRGRPEEAGAGVSAVHESTTATHENVMTLRRAVMAETYGMR